MGALARMTTRTSAPKNRQWWSISAMTAVILGLTLLGWGILIGLVAPQNLPLGSSGVLGVGIGVTAYTLGMRHAFDADHIAAIDNTTRKLMAEGQRPVSVGFWFALGHSSVVFVLCLLLSLGVRALADPIAHEGSTLQSVTGTFGTAVSGTFLLLIGVINLVVLRQIVGVFRRMRHGDYDEQLLQEQLDKRGLINRVLGRVTRSVRKPWHMYPVGLLFGLGFDTATEVSLLVLAGGAAAFQLPWYAILCLPVLFAAGMSLFDTIDGCFMNYAYDWAFAQPVRKIYYNMTITALSVVVALAIGSTEILGLLAEQLGLTGGPLAAIGRLDLNQLGFALVALFVVAWVVALLGYRLGRVEERWSLSSSRKAE